MSAGIWSTRWRCTATRRFRPTTWRRWPMRLPTWPPKVPVCGAHNGSKRVKRWTGSRTRPAPWWCRRPARLDRASASGYESQGVASNASGNSGVSRIGAKPPDLPRSSYAQRCFTYPTRSDPSSIRVELFTRAKKTWAPLATLA